MPSPNLITLKWPSPRRYPEGLYQHYCERHHAKLVYVKSNVQRNQEERGADIEPEYLPKELPGIWPLGETFSGYIRIGRSPSFSMGSQSELAWIDRDKFNQVLRVFNRVGLSGMRHVCRRDIPHK